MFRNNKIISKYSYKVNATFENLQTLPDYKIRMEREGYFENRLTEGQALHTALQGFIREYQDAQLTRSAMGVEVREAVKNLRTDYSSLTERIRNELWEQPRLLAGLGIAVGVLDRRGEFIDQAHGFYSKAIGDANYAAALTAIGILPERLQAGLDSTIALQTLCSQYEKHKGDCQRLVVERNNAYKKLKRYMNAFIAAARNEFKDNPQVMEMLSIFVRNQPKPNSKTDNSGDDTAAPAEPADTTDPTDTTDTSGTGEPANGTDTTGDTGAADTAGAS